MERKVVYRAVATQIAVLWVFCLASNVSIAAAPASIKLYVIDCGALIYNRPEDYGLTRSAVKSSNMAVSCYLIQHPRGTLLYDTGLDDAIVGQPIWAHIDGGYAQVKINTLRAQLSSIGVTPEQVTHLALSHSDWDHVGNANDFAGSLWLTPKAEYDFMFRPGVPAQYRKAYSSLEHCRSVIYAGDHDVFGDGTVILKATPGHTPGHQSLYVKLAKTGGVVLSGDLYHYAEERTLGRMPKEELTSGTPASRAAMDEFLKRSRSQLWIGHSIEFFAAAKKAPDYYE